MDGSRASIPTALMPKFEPIAPPRSHEYVAEQLRRPINLHLLPVGEALPPEGDLSAMFGVGRATLQAAVRMLEAEGLLRTKRGRFGGTFVVAPDTDAAVREYRLIRIRRESERISQALAFRELVEPSAAGEAAGLRTDEELREIEAAAAQAAAADSVLSFLARDSILHMMIAASAHNCFLRDAVEQVRIVVNEATILLSENLDPWRDTSAEHEELVSRIAAQDVTGSEKAMRRHLELTHRRIFELLEAA
jgi:GntR family transcriptional regulator, transcriptional repressor for pyruvate dehydrogenase complex